MLKKLGRKLPHWLEQLPDVPDQLLGRLANPPAPKLAIAPVPVPVRRGGTALAAALLVAASLVYGMPDVAERLAGLPVLSWVGLAVAALLLVRRA
jgi:hypothetical protein